MEERLSDFTAALASVAPAPGGGGAAAVMGALAASLGAMASGIAAARKSAEDPARLSDAAERFEKLRLGFLALIEADAAAFLPLSAAYALPRDTPGRADTLRRASLDACAAVERLLRLGHETAALLKGVQPLIPRLLLSDLGCAAASCRAALLSAAYNILINIRPYPEDAEAQRLRSLVNGALRVDTPALECIERLVLAGLGGETL